MPLARPHLSLRRRPALLAAFVLTVACGGGSTPTLESLTLGDGVAYAEVGAQQQLTATGHYSDGTDRALTAGLTWRTSDPSLVAVSDTGLLTPWAKGDVQITATDPATGASSTRALTARAMVRVTGSASPTAGRVDTSATYFHVSGLVPGGMVTPSVVGMSDDVDLAVFGDLSMAPGSLLCDSVQVGDWDEWCVAPASATGELWIAVDGEWTRDGATFTLQLPASEEVALTGPPLTPATLPYAGAVGATHQFLGLTGLTPGQAYEVRLSNLTADIDLAVYADRYEYRSLCESFRDGTADDACVATAGADGAFVVEVDGRTTLEGGGFTLSVTPRA
jgi:hypothetical protein